MNKNVKEKIINYDLLTVIMLGLGNANTATDEPILRLLDVLLSAETKPEEKKAILEKDFDIKMSSLMSEEANIMCNLGEGIRERTVTETRINDVLKLSLKMSAEKYIENRGLRGSEEKYLNVLKRHLMRSQGRRMW